MMTSGLGQRLRAAVLSIQLSAYAWLEALLAETLLLFDEARPATERGIPIHCTHPIYQLFFQPPLSALSLLSAEGEWKEAEGYWKGCERR
jgi:hypothetical protein